MKKFLTALLIGMLLLIFSVVFIITRSLTPLNQAKTETVELASRRADLVEENEFYWYNGTESYFTITGMNSDNTNIIVIVQQNGGNIEVFNQEETISKSTAIQQTINREQPMKILQARIGMYQELPVWEVSFELENEDIGYTYYSLTTGEWLKTIKNI